MIDQTLPKPTNQWVKYLLIVFTLLLIINLALYLFYLKGRGGVSTNDFEEIKDEQGFSLTKPNQTISRAGYSIVFSNPRYESVDAQNFFRVDVTLTNESVEPTIKVIANCDIEEDRITVRQGVGVSVKAGESRPILPGNSNSWTAEVLLDNANQKVSSCIYAPEGVFDPEKTIRVEF